MKLPRLTVIEGLLQLELYSCVPVFFFNKPPLVRLFLPSSIMTEKICVLAGRTFRENSLELWLSSTCLTQVIHPVEAPAVHVTVTAERSASQLDINLSMHFYANLITFPFWGEEIIYSLVLIWLFKGVYYACLSWTPCVQLIRKLTQYENAIQSIFYSNIVLLFFSAEDIISQNIDSAMTTQDEIFFKMFCFY